jgi:hypothetical protein
VRLRVLLLANTECLESPAGSPAFVLARALTLRRSRGSLCPRAVGAAYVSTCSALPSREQRQRGPHRLLPLWLTAVAAAALSSVLPERRGHEGFAPPGLRVGPLAVRGMPRWADRLVLSVRPPGCGTYYECR